MKPELAEKLYIEDLFKGTLNSNKVSVKGKNYDIQRLTGDASTRRYYRIKTSEESFVACLDNPLLAGKPSPFIQVQKAFFENRVRVPMIYDLNLEKGYILEEDLGDITLLRRLAEVRSEAEEYDLYERTIKELIKIHSLDVQKYSGEQFAHLAFDFQKLNDEVKFTCLHLIERFFNYNCNKVESSMLSGGLEKICLEIAEHDRVLTHRDFHSRNIMMSGDNPIVIDFQDARMGIPQYDLVSLLEDCYYKISIANKEKLIKYYWTNYLEKTNLQDNFQTFERLYDFMAIQRIFKALGTFSYIYLLRNDIRYLKYIGYGFENLKLFLAKYSELDDLRICLSRIYYEH